VCLPREAAARAQGGRVDEAGALRREAQILLAQVQLPNIVVALTTVLVPQTDVAAAPRRVVGGEGKLSRDLLERVLRVGQPELVPEEGRFRGPAVRRGRRSDGVERRLDVRLGFLHQARDVEHGFLCFGPAKSQVGCSLERM
jgi:hypothetical protein